MSDYLETSREKFHKNNKNRINNLLIKFPDYNEQIDKTRIQDYLGLFDIKHMGIALKMLDKVNYFSNSRTTKQLRLLVSLLESKVSIKNENIYFCSMSISSGKSTESIMQKVRDLSKMDSSKYDDKFIHLSDLEKFRGDRKRRIIIFVDDFIGSGDTALHLWNTLQARNWYNSNHMYYLATIIGYKNSIQLIEYNTPFRILCAEEPFLENMKIFHKDNSDFDTKEKMVLKKYCKNVDSRSEYMYGYGNSQSLVIFFYNAPNNTIPILHHTTQKWLPLFPRLE